MLAATLYRRSCEAGFAAGCTSLARFYADGDGVPLDPARARRLLRRGCEGGDGKGCFFLIGALAKRPSDRRFRIEDLVPRGVIRTPAGFLALVLDADDRPAFLTPGQRLVDGVVLAVSATETTFRQDVSDPLSVERTREVRMPLTHGSVVPILAPDRLTRVAGSPAPVGATVGLRLRQARIADVLALFSHVTGLELVADPSLTAEITVALDDVPWDLALARIADEAGLAVAADGSALRLVAAGRPAASKPLPALAGAIATMARAPVATPEIADRLERLARMVGAPAWRRRLAARVQGARGRDTERTPEGWRDDLRALDRILPDGPEAGAGVEELRALIAGRAGDAPLLEGLRLEVKDAVVEPVAHVPVEMKAKGRLRDLDVLLDRLSYSIRAMDMVRLSLSPAPAGRIEVAASVRMHFLPPGDEPAAEARVDAKRYRIMEARVRSEAPRSFLYAIGRLSRDRVELATAVFEDDGVAPQASISGKVGWPMDVAHGVTPILARDGFTAESSEASPVGACQAFQIRAVASVLQVRALGASPDETDAPFEPLDDLCGLGRDEERLPAVHAEGHGPLSLRLREADLTDVFRALYLQSGQGFVVDGDVVGRVSVDLRWVTLEEALAALAPAGVLVSAPAPMRRVSRVASGAPRVPSLGDGGPPVTLDFKQGPIADVLRLMEDIEGRPVWRPPALAARVSVFAGERPWNEVRDAVLDAVGLTLREEAGRAIVEGTPGPVELLAPGARPPMLFPQPTETRLEALHLSGVASTDGGWMAFAYDPLGRMRTVKAGDHLADAVVREIGPTYLLVETAPPAEAAATARPTVLRYVLPGDDPPSLRVAADTTGVGPLLPDGGVDYAALVNARFSAGVTEASNAWPLLAPSASQVVGGVSSFSADQLRQRLAEAGQTVADKDHFYAAFSAQWQIASRRPWTEAECPLIADWLRVNEKALATMTEAARRPRLSIPFEEGKSIADVPLPSFLGIRNGANALVARSLRRRSDPGSEGAAADVLTVARLGRLLSQGPTLIHGLIAAGVDDIAAQALPLLAARLPPPTARALLADLQRLPERRSLAEAVDTNERFLSLMALASDHRVAVELGPAAWRGSLFVGELPEAMREFAYQLPASAYDWDEALRFLNQRFDLMVAAFRSRTAAERAAVAGGEAAQAAALAQATEELGRPEVQDLLRGNAVLPPSVRRALARELGFASVPHLMRAQVSRNEADAALQVGMATLAVAAGDPPPLPTGPLDGYVYAHEGRGRELVVTATPEVKDKTGVRRFCADAAGHRVARSDDGPLIRDGQCIDPEEAPARATAADLLPKAEAKVREAEAVAVGLAAFQREVALVESRLETIKPRLPASVDVEGFSDELHTLAAGSGLRVSRTNFETEALEGYERARVRVAMNGPSDAVDAFLPRIAHMVRIAHVVGRQTTEQGEDVTIDVFGTPPAASAPDDPCRTLDTGRALSDCCRRARFDLLPESRGRLEQTCSRLDELRAILGQMDDLAAKREVVTRKIGLVEQLRTAAPPLPNRAP